MNIYKRLERSILVLLLDKSFHADYDLAVNAEVLRFLVMDLTNSFFFIAFKELMFGFILFFYDVLVDSTTF